MGLLICVFFQLRPGAEETKANFELYWNKDVDDTQNVILEFKQRALQIESRLRYPGRDITLQAGLR